jgi:hypothetical protein
MEAKANANAQEIMLMKQRVEEMEREAKKLREMQAEAEAKARAESEETTPMDAEDDKSLADQRSIYVGNVRHSRLLYICEETEWHVGRVRGDTGGHPGAFPGVRDN